MNCQIFSDFPDHRVTGRCHYSISDLLTIALLTYLCGGENLFHFGTGPISRFSS